MAVRALVTLAQPALMTPDTILRRRTERVEDFGAQFQAVVEDLIDTMLEHRIAVGLAAPQIGVSLNVAVINVSDGKDPRQTLIIANPVIENESGKNDTKRESCMSVPHYGGPISRRSNVVVRYQDRHGASAQLRATGFLARVLTHEIDHLNGCLYLDRLRSIEDLVEVDIFAKN